MSAHGAAPTTLHLPRLREVITEFVECDPAGIVPGADLHDDLGVDAIPLAQIISRMEEVWRVAMPDDDAWPVMAVRDLLKLLDDRGAPILPARSGAR